MADGTEIDHIGASIALMEAQIAKLRNAIETLESVRPIMGQAPSASSARGAATDASFGHDAFFGMTAAEAAKRYLNATKKTASSKTISDALIAGGWKTSSKNVPENVRTILNRHAAFVVINGEFGLAEWYPGRKSKPKKTASLEEWGKNTWR
jgi:hypothetical protein